MSGATIRDFLFHIGNIEDAVIKRLEDNLSKAKAPQGYVKSIASYGGELDREVLRDALAELAPNFPLLLVAYGSGKDERDPSDAALPNEPQVWVHKYGITVVTCDADARGEKARRRGIGGARGAYGMVDDVRRLLLGHRFTVEIEGEAVFLNTTPFMPAAVELIAKLPDITAYAVHFDSSYKYDVVPQKPLPIEIDAIDFQLDFNDTSNAPNDSPGVFTK